MSKGLIIIDKDYTQWVENLSARYRRSQIKAAVKVNREMLQFYWELGRDICAMKAESRWGSKFMTALSRDLKAAIPEAACFSPTNLLYMKNFYCLYSQLTEIAPQVVEQSDDHVSTPLSDSPITPQLVEQLKGDAIDQTFNDILSVPWGHHRYIIDRFAGDPETALFYVRKTIENGWSRSVLLNFMDSGLHERQGKAVTNFRQTLPDTISDLAQELTRDPYCFAFTGLRERYNERQLKDALVENIQRLLLELGTGFAYMGREYRLKVGQAEQFLDMLFYNVRLRCYVVVEVKTEPFSPAHIGQIGTYVVAVDHILRTPADNKTIGLLICKTKDNVFAQYALEGSNQPLGISEYELSKLYPEKVEGTIPSIEEIEARLGEMTKEQTNEHA